MYVEIVTNGFGVVFRNLFKVTLYICYGLAYILLIVMLYWGQTKVLPGNARKYS